MVWVPENYIGAKVCDKLWIGVKLLTFDSKVEFVDNDVCNTFF